MSESAARQQAREVFGAADESISRYVDILLTRGLEWGLLGPREGDRIWERHILNSVAIESVIPNAALVVDVGSGAGLPGLPIAIRRPDLTVTLLEPLERRATFLQLAIDELHLGDRVRVVRERAEEHRETYDVVTCRAVAALPRLLGWTAPLFDADGGNPGELVALKGASAQREVEEAAELLRRLRLRAEVRPVRAHPDAEPTYALRVFR